MAFDIYQDVTDRIVSMLERGVRPWAPQWDAKGSCPVIPTRANGEPYRGINVALLWGAAEARGFQSQQWMTFNQAKALGGCVRKGAKAERVVYWGTFKAGADDDDDGEGGKDRLFAKSYSVFNVGEIDGLPASYYEGGEPLPEIERIANAEAWAKGSGADIRHGGNRAFFSPAHDFVQMPPAGAFPVIENYYSTLAHELTHWTGHKARLDREFGKRFGNRAYAFEELVAELGAAFAMARLGISSEPREDHAAYLESWLKVLKEDKRAIFTAASKAQAACDLLFNLAEKAAVNTMPVQAPVEASGVICLPDLTKPVSGPEIAPVVDPVADEDGDDDTPPPVAPMPSPTGFGERVAAFSRKSFRPFGIRRAVARRIASTPVLDPISEPVAEPVADSRSAIIGADLAAFNLVAESDHQHWIDRAIVHMAEKPAHRVEIGQAAADYARRVVERADGVATPAQVRKAHGRLTTLLGMPTAEPFEYEAPEPVAAPPAPARPFHPRREPSLCEYLSDKGICDDGGELSARDLDRWHREAPFRRRLVRADGVSLERAAFDAWEAGYFPDVPVPAWDASDNMHPVTPDMLIAALERELANDYAHVWGDHDREFFQ